MSKTLLVARYEFRRHVWRKGFLFTVLGIPLLFILIIGGIVLFFTAKHNVPVGVVDHSGQLISLEDYVPPEERPVQFISFATEAAAYTALNNDEIQGFYVVPDNYLDTGQLSFIHDGNPYEGIGSDFRDYLRASLLTQSDLSPEIAGYFIPGSLAINTITLDQGSNSRNNPAGFFIAFVFALVFVISVFTTAGFLVQAVVDEKENRTMEILITSLRPESLMTGKIIGLVALGFTQIIIWLIGAFIATVIARANIPNFPVIEIPGAILGIGLLWFVPYYIMIAALITAVGVSVTAVSEGQQLSGIISVTSMVPFWFFYFFITSPNSPLVVALSLIPLTSPLSLIIRWSITEIPLWQMIISWGLLAGTAVFSVFLVGRLMKVGMLRYGKKLTLRDAFKALRLRSV